MTKPFGFEGKRRQRQAEEGIATMAEFVDTLIVIPNDRLLIMSDVECSMEMAFKMADDVLRQGVQSIAELILVPGEINLDFADVKAVMDNAGPGVDGDWRGNRRRPRPSSPPRQPLTAPFSRSRWKAQQA